jgi:pimeloyl-ACP methyl ester carboxylesterase
MRTERVTTSNGTYAVHVDGDDPRKPFAVFLHGGPGLNCHAERSFLGGRFRAEVNVLWFDLLGCGDFQPASDAPYEWDTQIHDVATIIRHFTPEPVHFVGHCLGAEIVHDLIRLDRTFARTLLWYTPVRSLAVGLRRVLQKSLEEGRFEAARLTAAERADAARFLTSSDHELGARDAQIMLRVAEVTAGFFEFYWLDRVAMARWAERFSEHPLSVKAYLELTTQFYERGVVPLPDYAGVPVHMLYSDVDPVTPWEEHGELLMHRIPHATAAVIRGAGHFIHLERQDECVRHTLAFFARN